MLTLDVYFYEQITSSIYVDMFNCLEFYSKI